MDERQLRAFTLFANLDDVQARTVVRHARCFHFPAGRWLLRSGRRLKGSYFLLNGRVRCWPGQWEMSHRARSAREPLYPGADALFTISAVRVLQVDLEPIAFLLADAGDQLLRELPNEPWLQRWLESPLLQRIERVRWQHLLRSLEPETVAAAEVVVRQGEPGDCFYVLREGCAQVRRGSRVLASLRPGDVFGEDALLARAPRNATVQMQTDGMVMRLPRRPFLELLVRGVVRSDVAGPAGSRCRLVNVGRASVPGAASLPLGRLRESAVVLSRKFHYLVTGGSMHMRVLGCFLLLQLGFDASVHVEAEAMAS